MERSRERVPLRPGLVKGGRPPGRTGGGRGGGASSLFCPALSRGPLGGRIFGLSVGRGGRQPVADVAGVFPGPLPESPEEGPAGRGGGAPFSAPDLVGQRVQGVWEGRRGTSRGARGLASARHLARRGLGDGSRPMSCGAGVATPRPQPVLKSFPFLGPKLGTRLGGQNFFQGQRPAAVAGRPSTDPEPDRVCERERERKRAPGVSWAARRRRLARSLGRETSDRTASAGRPACVWSALAAAVAGGLGCHPGPFFS